MRKGTRLVALVAALPQYCSAVEGCLRRADVEEASRILEASGRSRLKANLELGRRVLKLLKKSVLSVSSSMRHTLHSATAPVRARKSPLTHQPPRTKPTFRVCACDLLERYSKQLFASRILRTFESRISIMKYCLQAAAQWPVGLRCERHVGTASPTSSARPSRVGLERPRHGARLCGSVLRRPAGNLLAEPHSDLCRDVIVTNSVQLTGRFVKDDIADVMVVLLDTQHCLAARIRRIAATRPSGQGNQTVPEKKFAGLAKRYHNHAHSQSISHGTFSPQPKVCDPVVSVHRMQII